MKKTIIKVFLLAVLGGGVSLFAASLPFHETFETNAPMAGTPGVLNGQHGWSDPSSNATVQVAEVWELDQAVSISNAEISQTLDGAHTNIQVVFSWKPVVGDIDVANIPDNATAICWVNTNGLLSAYSNQIPMEISGVSVDTGQWSRILIQSDYATKKWSLWLDGTKVIDAFNFYTNSASGLTEVTFVSGDSSPAYLDDIHVSTSTWTPQPGDTDGDGLDDDWELAFFNSPNTLSDGTGDYDLDGLTDGEEEIAYTDPDDADAVFGMTSGTSQGDTEYVIRWPSASGRLYAVDSRTNLLNGIWSNIESNIAATPPENIYTVQVSTVDTRFTRLWVEKQ